MMNQYEQPQLITSDPAQDEIATLKAELRRLENEIHVLKTEKKHWQIASRITGNWHGGYGTLSSHVVEEDGIYIESVISGQSVTVFVDKEDAMSFGWMEEQR